MCDIVKECTLFCFMLSFAQEMAMPEISRFFGIVIKMLYEAGGKHNKPMSMSSMGSMRHPWESMERFWQVSCQRNSISL